MQQRPTDLVDGKGRSITWAPDDKGNPATWGIDDAGNPVIVAAKPKYLWLADQYGASVPPYPSDPPPNFPKVRGDGNRSWSYLDLPFDLPAGCAIKEMRLNAQVGNNDGKWPWLRVLGARNEPAWEDKDNLTIHDQVIFDDGSQPFMRGAVGHQEMTFWLWQSDHPSIVVKVTSELLRETVDRWREEVWTALFNTAQAAYFARQQDIAGRISALSQRLNNVDTLILRREESDEVMKNVLKFILGPGFSLMPTPIEGVIAKEASDINYGIAFDDESLDSLAAGSQFLELKKHEDIIRFVNEAIEWENVATFLYSYFWDVPRS